MDTNKAKLMSELLLGVREDVNFGTAVDVRFVRLGDAIHGETKRLYSSEGDLMIWVDLDLDHIRKFAKHHGDSAEAQAEDTLRHEFAHVLHIVSKLPLITSYAKMQGKGITRETMDVGHDVVFRGKDSHHGSEWKKFAKRMKCIPTAYARKIEL